MNGYQINFFTVQGRRHKGESIGDWLVQLAKQMRLSGATMISGAEGFGHHRRIHSARFIELSDQPLEVVMVLTAEESEHLFERLRGEGIHLFYCKTPAEFGTTPARETARSPAKAFAAEL